MGKHDLISISPPDRLLEHDLLDAPGGFAWWYMDLVNARGQGAVLIWSWGLPFLPGLASSARRGKPIIPRQRPSLNVCVYDRHQLDCYLLHEFAPDEVSWDREARRWAFGKSTFEVTRNDQEVTVQANLDCPIPGGNTRLLGKVDVRGVARKPQQTAGVASEEAVDPNHDWTPLMGPAHGDLELSFGGQKHYQFEARAYHDRNGGRAPLHDLGFSHWIWGRLPFADREMIYYILWPEDGGDPVCVAMEILQTGETVMHRDASVRLGKPHDEILGMSWHENIEVLVHGKPWLSVTPQCTLDNGPFYMRFFLDASTPDGQRARGIGEACTPSRVDLARHRPLVKMRVQQTSDEDNSMWLPLFTGPRRGRVERLLKYQLLKRL